MEGGAQVAGLLPRVHDPQQRPAINVTLFQTMGFLFFLENKVFTFKKCIMFCKKGDLKVLRA